jgi:hypothetical protein
MNQARWNLVARYWSEGHRTAMERELVDNGTCRRHAFPCATHRGQDITASAPTYVLPIRGPWQLTLYMVRVIRFAGKNQPNPSIQ